MRLSEELTYIKKNEQPNDRKNTQCIHVQQRFSNWGVRQRLCRRCADGWLNLRLRAMVQKCCHFVWSTNEKMCFCNTIKFTQNIFLSSKHSTTIRNSRDPSPSIAIFEIPVFHVKITSHHNYSSVTTSA